jgi:predicted metal-dependent phosphoesterase TrpH
MKKILFSVQEKDYMGVFMKKIDLHIHTNKSDGLLSPKEIIDEAKRKQVQTIAIADHDTVEAYTDEVYNYAKHNGIELITAVEISTKTKKCGIHVLGYNIDTSSKYLNESLKKIRNARHDYLHNVANKLNEMNYILNINKLDMIEAVTKAHIAMDIISNKTNEKQLLKQFGHIPSKGKFIETIMNENCPAYVKKETVTPKEAAEIIRKAGGKVVLAHPVAYVHEDNLTMNEILEIINDMKADGLEANYIYTDRNNNIVNEIEKWNKFAEENHLFVTIGSDFHMEDGNHAEIGLENVGVVLEDEKADEILEKIK